MFKTMTAVVAVALLCGCSTMRVGAVLYCPSESLCQLSVAPVRAKPADAAQAESGS